MSLLEGYLRPLAELPEIASRLPIDARVTAAARVGFGKMRTAGREAAPFDVRYTGWYRPESSMLASAVIDTSGTRATPGWAGASGIPAVGERKAGGRIVHGMPDVHGADRGRFAGKGTMVVGSGDSATFCTPAQEQAPDIAAE